MASKLGYHRRRPPPHAMAAQSEVSVMFVPHAGPDGKPSWYGVVVEPLERHWHLIVASIVLHFVLHYASSVVSPMLCRRYRDELSQGERDDWDTRVCAIFHAAVVFNLVPSYFAPAPGLSESLYSYSPRLAAIYSFSTGYFV